MESDNVNVERYINLVRNRAYKSETGSHIYKASDFLTNELAILHEKDKEFVQEGQRWWDLCRMKNAKDGIPLVFCKEGDIEGKRAVLIKKLRHIKFCGRWIMRYLIMIRPWNRPPVTKSKKKNEGIRLEGKVCLIPTGCTFPCI